MIYNFLSYQVSQWLYITSHPFFTGSLEHKWPAPNVSGFIAQLVWASHRYREVTGSNPVEVLTFTGFCSQLLKLRSKLRWSWLTWFQIRSSIYETFHISLFSAMLLSYQLSIKNASNRTQCDILQGQHSHNGHDGLMKNSQEKLSKSV